MGTRLTGAAQGLQIEGNTPAALGSVPGFGPAERRTPEAGER
jgi:hypothetical protein